MPTPLRLESSVALRRFLVALVPLALFVPGIAAAQPPDPALLERLAQHAKQFDVLVKRACFRSDTRVEELDGDGKVTSTQIEQARVEADGTASHQIIEHATKDGKDVTADEQARVKKEEAEAAKQKKDEGEGLSVPFASDAYIYDQVGVDSADPTRVEIAFTPKKPTKHTLEGKAWVDTTAGTILSAGAKLSKTPAFVDWIHFTVELGAKTPLGPAMSRLTFEGKGGILFFHKHFRGEVTMHDYRLVP